ncbi:MAG: hypothetical protein IPK67_18680 [Planctomycetes bacterium]|nr:hypothetical protein [Planctomycetota bacterium]
MGRPIGFLGSLRLGDRFITVDRELERVGAGVVPVFDANVAELPLESGNWRRRFTARFDKAESGSGPVGQWALHAFLDSLEAFFTGLEDDTAALGWVGDEERAAEVTVGGAAGTNVILTVDDLAPLDLALSDYVYFSGGAWGSVNVLGAAPPHTLRVAELSAAVAMGETCYRAWRVYPACRVLGFSPGEMPEESQDGFRLDCSLRLDSKEAPVRSTAWS